MPVSCANSEARAGFACEAYAGATLLVDMMDDGKTQNNCGQKMKPQKNEAVSHRQVHSIHLTSVKKKHMVRSRQ